MSDAQEQKDPVMQHFNEGRLPRLELVMLPRDPNRALGSARTALCSSFNYVKQYPKKLVLFIEVMKFVTNFAMAYQHYDEDRRAAAKEKSDAASKRKEAIKEVQSEVE